MRSSRVIDDHEAQVALGLPVVVRVLAVLVLMLDNSAPPAESSPLPHWCYRRQAACVSCPVGSRPPDD
jgi:hypothetical protein